MQGRRAKKIIILIVAALVLASLIRNLLDMGGVSTQLEDYATHINIEQHLKQGLIFPEAHKEVMGANAVHKYLPVYHGLVGFHLSSWLLESLGLPLPGAYGFLMDLSLLALLLCFVFMLREVDLRKKWFEALVAIVLFFSFMPFQFFKAVDNAFFSQVWAYTLTFLSFHSYSQKKFKLCGFLFLLSIITYPDILLWTLPVLFFASVPKYKFLYRGVIASVWLVLMLAFAKRIDFIGPFNYYNLFPLVFLIFVFALYAKDLFKKNQRVFYFTLSFISICTFFLILSMKNFNFSYYALKLTYPGTLFLLLLFIKSVDAKTFRGLLVTGLSLFFIFTYSDFKLAPIQKYFSASRNITNTNYQSTILVSRNLKSMCDRKSSLVLPLLSNASAENPNLLFWAANAPLLNFDIYDYSFTEKEFSPVFSNSFFELAYLFRDDIDKGYRSFVDKFDKASFKKPICLVVDAKVKDLFKDKKYQQFKVEDGYAYFKLSSSFSSAH